MKKQLATYIAAAVILLAPPVVAPAPAADFKMSPEMVKATAKLLDQDNRVVEAFQPASNSYWISIRPRPDGKRFDVYGSTICREIMPKGHSVVIHFWDADQMAVNLVDIGYFHCDKK